MRKNWLSFIVPTRIPWSGFYSLELDQSNWELQVKGPKEMWDILGIELTHYDIDFFYFHFPTFFFSFTLSFLFLSYSFSCSVTIGYCSLHQKGIRQKVQSHLALYRWSKFRFVCNARDTSFHLLLFGSSGDFAVQKRLNYYFPFSSNNNQLKERMKNVNYLQFRGEFWRTNRNKTKQNVRFASNNVLNWPR